MLKREDFSRERIDSIISKARKHGNFEIMSHEERDGNRRKLLERLDAGKDLWVFGYGSLIWNPAFNFAEKRQARLFGYHRSFCLHLTIGRGSREDPGLMLALDRGGSCNGVAFRIAAKDVESETDILWMREMISGAYKPYWSNMVMEKRVVAGLTFVINPKHSSYTGRLSLEKTVSLLKRGKGRLGTCKEYLTNTVEHLDDLNVRDDYLHRLCRLLEDENQKE